MKKRIVTMVLALLLALAACVPAFANSQIPVNDVNVNGQQQINYVYLSSIGSGLSIKNGYATCSGYLNLLENYNSSITIRLQRSTISSGWADVKSWSSSFSGVGSHSLEKGYYVSSGYTYRVMTIAQVKSGSTVLETATCYSPKKEY
ncbi:hypothetical protein Sgly_0105 [Syntrophobotulus glycolicus DSM 8271]|uniref:Uncharacterized protein n=1 Tax=Syntrophobotulus glycolicus (strain DSM 8271 / FlGlyR) TaxID=645991 RepID=F0SVK0_SYNGF|nr:hypothetical protein [Syntrophobotulus glycolicus]ADY54476.1 hypothetical protein Sgly_0105 [Syntrophobotulus glycolicus DSM 8271]